MSKHRHRLRKGEGLNSESLAGEASEAFKSDGVTARLARYGRARENALQFREYLIAQGEHPLADKLKACGELVTFREYFTIGETRLSKICTCKKHLVCPLCAIRRGAKALRVYLDRVKQLITDDPELRPYMVTLTVRNGDDLAERFDHLQKRVRYMHKLRHLRRGFQIDNAVSGVWSYEFTNRGNGWHPHVHAIWLCHDEPDKYQLSEEWEILTGDSFIVDVRPISLDDPIGGFCEVFKYALKFSDLDNPDRLHAHKTLRGRRLQDSFGELRGLDVEPSDQDELLKELPYIERLFRYVHGVGYCESDTTGEIINPEAKHAA